MARFIRAISIEGLFDLYDHEIELRQAEPVTIVAGPNGIGKTTLFGLTHSLMSGAFEGLARHAFATLAVESSDGGRIAIQRLEAPEPETEPPGRKRPTFLLTYKPKRGNLREETIRLSRGRQLGLLPPGVEQLGLDEFIDRTTGERISSDDVARRIARMRLTRRLETPDLPDWFTDAMSPTDFIETKRLDSLMTQRARAHRAGRSGPDRAHEPAPIHHYLDAVQTAMEHARFESTRIAQRRDRSFAKRLLDKASRRSVKESEIRARYSELEARASQYERNGLLADTLDVLSAEKLTPTDRWVLALFLDDFEVKSKPLQPVSLKLDQLRDIIDSKFLNKRLDLQMRRGVTFLGQPGEVDLNADALSSGEQHELALVSRLLFSVSSGTTVLIDEPELSLHVSWQHRMLDDFTAIARVARLRFVLATHSTAIINGRWDLVEELGPIDDGPAG